MSDDKRLIEDYLPVMRISEACEEEESFKKSRFGRPFGHPHQIHKWWANRPLVACRAAVYGALVPASRFRPKNGPEEKRENLTRANAARFVEALCKYPGDPQVIAQAQAHVLEAHAERLARETGKEITVEDIKEGRASVPKVLDMFAGGGSIPLEALRLGCEAYALDLNPVAYIIELCTLVYPQKYGKPARSAKGADKDGTWAGLAEEFRFWGNWVVEKVKTEINDLYLPIADPNVPKTRQILGKAQLEMAAGGFVQLSQQKLAVDTSGDYLTPVAYLWTRVVQCKNPRCSATVPLVKQTWLCKKKGRYIALKVVAPKDKKCVRFEVVESTSEDGLGFDPEAFSKGGNATCAFCGTVADSEYVKAKGCGGQMSQQMMAVVCARMDKRGKVYFSADELLDPHLNEQAVNKRIAALCARTGVGVPDEPIITDAKNSCWTHLYGLTAFGQLFSPRQMLCLLSMADAIREAEAEVRRVGYDQELSKALMTFLGAWLDTFADYSSSLCRWKSTTQQLISTFGRQALPMVWDFAEPNPFGEASGDLIGILRKILAVISRIEGNPGVVTRGPATTLPWPDAHFDAVITDPPYYDNVPYADISDFFYVWLKRTIGHFYPQHFAAQGTPKKSEVVADATRHGGDRDKAKRAYEQMMAQAFAEAHRVLKPDGPMAVVYAHKTTVGWATLVDALRKAGFTITEAWPLDTEMKSRLRGMESAALASSIFLVARKRHGAATGNFEDGVRPELEQIVRERVNTLWEMGISGADLVIACVGAGLRAFTKYARVEYGNGEEVPAERFLREVETAVLETILTLLSKEVGGNGGKYGLAGLDPPTRFYVLWRYTYKTADLDAGEAIIFANGTHVELDGLHSLSYGSRPLVEKKKDKYRLLDYADRGEDAKLGLPSEDGQSAPLVDALHRLLWLMERHPSGIPEFLREAGPNTEQMRLAAQALAGPALKGGELGEVATGGELAALTKLTANWRSVVEDAAGPAEGPLFKATSQRE